MTPLANLIARRMDRKIRASLRGATLTGILCAVTLVAPANADERVEQCVQQFFDSCAAATTDPEGFLERFAQRDGAHLYTTPDGSTQVAAITSARDLEAGAGIWERFSVSAISDAQFLACSFDCSFEYETDQSKLAENLNISIDALEPDVTLVGGLLTDNPDADIGTEWWGERTFFAHGWSPLPEHVALIRQHCCGLTINSTAQVRISE